MEDFSGVGAKLVPFPTVRREGRTRRMGTQRASSSPEWEAESGSLSPLSSAPSDERTGASVSVGDSRHAVALLKFV